MAERLARRLGAQLHVVIAGVERGEAGWHDSYLGDIRGRGRLVVCLDGGTAAEQALRNTSDNQHVFHVHGTSFTVLDYDGARPPPS